MPRRLLGGAAPVTLRVFLLIVLLFPASAWSADDLFFSQQERFDSGISGNPGATNVVTGNGMLGRLLGFGPDSGVRIGGLWAGDLNYLMAGGLDPNSLAFNSLLLVELNLDLERLLRIPGALFGIEFLQVNTDPTNAKAGSVTGYNGLQGPPPLVRSELYELWWRQKLFDDKLVVRIGKIVPTYDFNNVTRPLALHDETLAIPAVSGLIMTPIAKNPTLIGAMPGYINSAYGITMTVTPTKALYLSYGIYDGNQANHVQTGLNVTPEFNGYYFTIGEVGYAWRLGSERLPGSAAIGGWHQSGELTAGPPRNPIRESGANGFYMFANQRLWLRHPGVDNSGVSGYFQFGVNDSDTMIANKYIGAGLTGFNLVPGRPRDSMGAGMAVSWLNQRLGFRHDEIILQTYYQMHVLGDIFVQPTLTHIPNPGANRRLPPATAFTLRVTVPF